MKIRQLELKNFRCFEHKVFEFSDQFNVLIGDNGTGKTAILDALAIGAGSFFLGIDEMVTRSIRPDEVRQVRIQSGDTPTSDRFYPVTVTCQGIVAEREIEWSRSLISYSGRTTAKDARLIQEIAKALQDRARSGDSVILPLVSYYGTGRLWWQKKDKSIEILPPRARRYGYLDCLEPASNHKQLLKWMKTMEMASIQRRSEINVLSALKESIGECMENWRSVFYDILEDDLMATSDDGKMLPFRMLSDGVRNMLAMVGDITYRAATLNPHLKADVSKQTPGIVLIDEIDLHLHPKWQRRVIEDLKRTFPKIQFFATTHSEHIIQSLRDGELIDLNNYESIPEAAYENKSIEDIAENVMHVPNIYRSERYQKMMEAAQKYYHILQKANDSTPEEIERLKVELDDLIEPFSDNVAYHAFLKMKRAAMLNEE